MKATVIINTVNEVKERLINAINSYKNQKGVDLTILISTIENDISVEIAKQLNVEYIINPKKGIYNQLNNAVKHIKTEWWCYASGNDIADENKIRTEIECCLKENKLICYSNFYKRIPDVETRLMKFPEYDYNLHLTGNFVNDCAIIHSSLNKYLPFRDDLWGNDAHYDFWLRIFEGEGDVFCHNPEPTWTYIEWQDSKHIVRQKSEQELQEYKLRRKKMIDSRKEKPLISVGLPLYKSNICWLAMESLCRQQTNIKWELIIAEEQVEHKGKEYFEKYRDRLFKVGCIDIKYLPITKYSENADRIALSVKWKIIVDSSSEYSQALILQAGDCYSEPLRIQTTYEKIKEGYDWVQNRFGLFYHLKTKQSILFDLKTIKQSKTGLNMAIRMSIAIELPLEEKWQYVDSWLYNSALQINGRVKTYTFDNNNYLGGVDTDGENNISLLRKNYYNEINPPFKKTNLSIIDCLPSEIIKMIQERYDN